MKLSTFSKKVSGVKLAKSGTLMNKVRELEMDNEGFYNAFVDDGKDSFDVGVSLSEKNDVTSVSCDCGADEMPCVHIIAVLRVLEDKQQEGNKETKKPVKEKKVKPVKISPVLKFAENLDKEEMLAWLFTTMEKDQRLFAVFKNHFQTETDKWTHESIKETMSNAITAVISKRKTIQVHELASIFEIWKPLLDKVIKGISKEIHTVESVMCIQTVQEEIINLDHMLAKSTSRVATFYEKFIQLVGQTIFKLDEEKKLIFFKNYFSNLKKAKDIPIDAVYGFSVYGVSPGEGKIGEEILKNLKVYLSLGLHDTPKKTWVRFLEWLEEMGLMESAILNLETQYYNYEFNKTIIEAATKYGQFQRAILWSFECISTNFYEEYNIPFYTLIENTLDQANNIDLEIQTRNRLAELRTSYKDFLFFLQQTKNELDLEDLLEKYSKKYVKPQIYQGEITKIKMKIFLIKGRHDMAIKKIDDERSLLETMEMWDDLYKLDSELLLKTIIKVINRFSYYQLSLDRFSKVKKWLFERYEKEEIFSHLNTSFHSYITIY